MKRFRLAAILLIIPVFCAAEEQNEAFLFSHSPGSYPRDIYLELEKAGPAESRLYYYFEESSDRTPVPYSAPLHLTALKGESRTYSLVVFEKDREDTKNRSVYIIDRRKPPEPAASIDPGIFFDEIALTFQYGGDETVYYSIKSEDYAEYGKWDGKPLLLQGKNGYLVTYKLGVYAVDGVGNRSKTARYTYVINKNTKSPGKYLDIISPVEGTFQNTQLLACMHRGFTWIRYTVNGDNPVTEGTEYTKPVLLPRRGRVLLRIAGYAAESKEIIEKKVEYYVSGGAQQPVSPGSGVITEKTRVTLSGGGPYRYTLDDTSPGAFAEKDFSGLLLELPQNLQRPVILRLADTDLEKASGEAEQRAGDYRYTYILDGWKPSAPVCTAFQGDSSDKYTVALAGERGAVIYYSLDGSEPHTGSARYKAPFTVKNPGNEGVSAVTVKAAAVSHTGNRSETTEKRLIFRSERPAPPRISRESSTKLILAPPEDGEIIYEKSDEPLALPVPDERSPAITGDIDFSVPYGMEKTAFIQLAVRDKSGNISEPSEVFQLSVDNQPPAKPVIKYLDGIVKISHTDNSRVFFTLSRETDGKFEIINNEDLYEKPFFVFGKEKKKLEYKLRAYAVDEAGNNSGETETVHFTVDKREPVPLSVSGVENGGIYRGPVSIRFSSAYPDQEVLYNLALEEELENGETEFLLDAGSSRAENGVIELTGEEGGVRTYILAYAPYLKTNGKKGELRKLSFTIDREFPAVPEISGIVSEGIYTNGISIVHENPTPGETVYYSLAAGGTAPPDCFGDSGRKLVSPMHINGEIDRRIAYSLLIGSIDKAGNKTYSKQLYLFTIDREAPPAPAVSVQMPENPDMHAEVLVETGGNSVYYELSEGNTLPDIPDENSALYEAGKPIILNGREGRETSYHIRLIAVDSAGNRSAEAPVYSVTIDRKAPESAGGPVYTSYKSGSVDISWEHIQGPDIFYSFDGTAWEKYESPLNISAGAAESIRYYFKDGAGNASEVVQAEIPAYRKSADIGTFLSGAENGKRYGEAVTLYADLEGYVCRYETALAERHLQSISQFSPIMNKQVKFNVLSGETSSFYVAAQLFDPKTNLPVSEQQNLHFSIDKTKPRAPEFEIAEDTYFQDAVTVPIRSAEGMVIYSVTRFDALGNILESEQEIKYEQPVTLDIPKGEYSSFELSAYTVDEAGNQSPVVAVEDLVIDKKIIYVSRLGNDLYSGSRTRPFKTPGKAVEYAKETGRNIIYISGGQFEVDDPLLFDEDLFLQGGFEPFQWKSGGTAETIISAGEHLQAEAPIFKVNGGVSHISSITVLSGTGNPLPLQITGAELYAEDVTVMNMENSTMPLVLQDGGLADFHNCKISSYSLNVPSIIVNSGGELNITKTTVENKARHRGKLQLLRVVENGSVQVRNSVLICGAALESTAIHAEKSSVTSIESAVSTGLQNSRSFGITAKSSEIHLQKSDVVSDDSTRINTLIAVSEDSNFIGKNSRLSISGRTGGIGIKAADSIIDLYSSLVSGENSSEFLYPFQFDNTRAVVQNNFVSVRTSGDYIGFNINGGSSKIYNNTVIFDEGSGNSYAVWSKDGRQTDIVNNIILQKNGGGGAASAAIEGDTAGMRVIANNFHGWAAVMQEGGEIYETAADVNTADGDARGGRLHKNISESFTNVFLITKTEAPYYLKQTSRCVNGGIDIEGAGGLPVDFEGDVRPNPDMGLQPAYDIGADEY